MPAKGLTETWTYEAQNGFSHNDMSQISQTIGYEISAGIKGTVEAGKGDCKDGKNCVKGGAEVSIEGKYSNTLTKMSASSSTQLQTQLERITYTVGATDFEWAIAAWSLVDKFELKDYSGRIVRTWENVNPFRRVHQWYPRTAATDAIAVQATQAK